MSAVYPTLRGTLLGWALNDNGPADAEIWVAGVDSSYTYDANDSQYTDLGGAVLFTGGPLNGAVSNIGLIDADDIEITGVTPGPTLDALVVYLTYTGGTQLICYIDSSTDASLPITLVNTEFGIRWHEDGICRI